MATNPYQVYQQNSITTASPGELTLMLYNGCLKFLKKSKQAIQEGNIQEKNTNLIKAQDIIQEFMNTLDLDIPIAHDMLQMYDYIYRRLIEANTKNSVEIVDELEGYVTEFRDTWKEVLRINREQQYGNGGTV